MEKSVVVRFDVRCDWKISPPEYRIYVNDELFTERTFKYTGSTYIKEMLQVKAPPGIYEFRLEELRPKTGKFTISNIYVATGDAAIVGNNKFEITR